MNNANNAGYKKYPYPENLMMDLFIDRSSFTNEEISDIINIVDNRLKPRYRDAIHLRYEEHLSYIKMGKRLEVSSTRTRQLTLTALRMIIHRQSMEKTMEKNAILKKKLEQQYAENPGLIPIENLNLTSRCVKALKWWRDIDTVEELMELTKDELYNTRNLGKKSVNVIIEALENHGINADKFK